MRLYMCLAFVKLRISMKRGAVLVIVWLYLRLDEHLLTATDSQILIPAKVHSVNIDQGYHEILSCCKWAQQLMLE